MFTADEKRPSTGSSLYHKVYSSSSSESESDESESEDEEDSEEGSDEESESESDEETESESEEEQAHDEMMTAKVEDQEMTSVFTVKKQGEIVSFVKWCF